MEQTYPVLLLFKGQPSKWSGCPQPVLGLPILRHTHRFINVLSMVPPPTAWPLGPWLPQSWIRILPTWKTNVDPKGTGRKMTMAQSKAPPGQRPGQGTEASHLMGGPRGGSENLPDSVDTDFWTPGPTGPWTCGLLQLTHEKSSLGQGIRLQS